MRIDAIYRYPVKSLSPELLASVEVRAGAGVPLDRAFAIARPGSAFRIEQPRHVPKTNFLTLMRDEALARVSTEFDPENQQLTLRQEDRVVLEARLSDADGRRALADFLAGLLGLGEDHGLQVVNAPPHMFSDVAEKCLSLINLASLRELEAAAGCRLDPLRFRANIYFEGTRAWEELDWVGRTLHAGKVELEVFKPIERCAAVNVNPETGVRDVNLPRTLMKAFGHVHLGVYALVRSDGRIAVGDELIQQEE